MMDKLRARNMDFEEEEDVAGFLGVHVERAPEHAKLTQKGLTKRIIEALQIEDLPAVAAPATLRDVQLELARVRRLFEKF